MFITTPLSIHDPFIKVIVVVILSVLIIFLWYWQRVPEKTKKNRIGFVVCISCENDETSNKLREDFIIPLRRLVTTGSIGKRIQFIELSPLISSKIIDENDAAKLSIDTRAHFVLYGRVRKRMALD